MSGRKRLRKNFYKNSTAKRRARIKRRVFNCLKLFTGVTFLMMASFVFIFGYDFFTQCDYFSAESVTVKGAEKLSDQEILKQADIGKGMNILSVNLPMIRKRLLAHSWIADAEVSRELPSKITIKITEHHPLAVLDLGRKFIINVHGEIFKEKTASDPKNLPMITGLEYSDLRVYGDRSPRHGRESGAAVVANDDGGGGHDPGSPFDAALDVLRLGQQSESVLPNKIIKRIQVDRELGLTLYASYDEPDRVRAIKLGYHDYSSKYDMLKDILFHLKKREIFPDFTSIDLNNVNRIVVNPVRVESPAEKHKEV